MRLDELHSNILGKLKFNPVPRNQYLELGADAQVHCNAEAEVRPKVRWMKGSMENADIHFSPHITDDAEDGTLYFHGVRRMDEGLYTCVAMVTVGASQELINRTINIYVVGK